MAIPVLPPSAPFTSEQRAYLNGFFAGVFGLDSNSGGADLSAVPAIVPAALTAVALVQSEPVADESTPWHDPSLGIEERLELAQDRPQPQKMMAAMAQLDCGQCGYLCKTYAQALADGSETSLRKCIPGGKETATKLKELMASS